jgi:hypothetical protein
MNKSKAFILIFVTFILPSGCRNKKALENGYEAVVSENHAYFKFPVENADGTWKWDVGPDSILNYEWMVKVTLAGESIELGYSKYKFEGTTQQEGTLQMLLMSGQVNFWKNRKYDQGRRGLKAFRDKNSIVIFMENKEYLEKFQNERPRFVLFKTDGNMIDEKNIRIPVKYQINEPEI